MNFKLTISLVIVLLLATILFLFLPKGAEAPKQANGTTPLLADHPKVKSITYIQDGAVQLQFEKQDDKWQMTQPMKAAVDEFSVNPIAGTLEDLSYRRKFEPEDSGDKSPQATGTDKPRNVVKFTGDTGKEYTVSFGKRSNDGYYATLNGDKAIYVLAATPIDALDKDPDTFRNKLIKQIDTSKITRLEVKTKDSDVTLAKNGDKWTVTSPISARANQVAAEDIAKSFSEVRALNFSTLDKNITQLNTPCRRSHRLVCGFNRHSSRKPTRHRERPRFPARFDANHYSVRHLLQSHRSPGQPSVRQPRRRE